MSDQASRHAARLLDALAVSNAQMVELARQLRSRPEVLEVSQRFECKQYDSGTVLEGYVDAELLHGQALTWWLETQWKADHWSIEAAILLRHDADQDTLVRIADSSVASLDECLIELDRATAKLLDSLESVDLAAPALAG